ncbi:hypothetical protein ElyMa_004845700 [Elysia marginata]|uniref:Uncharacterized protein n=1 Tax=Elysia marginata TaxID=1093978 RepID=A0AAV4IP37_9GAST|nr:hypothetical protein ElyMa_004845700 [Elysia marginata]
MIPAAAPEGHGVMNSQNSSLTAIPPIKPRPRLEFGPAKPKTDYGIFSAKKSGGSSSFRKNYDIEMALKGGVGEAASPTGRGPKDKLKIVDLDEDQLPGASDIHEAKADQRPHLRISQLKQPAGNSSSCSGRNKSGGSEVSRNSSSTQASSSEDEMEQLMWEQMQRQQQQQQQSQKTSASPSTKTGMATKQQRVQQLRTVTVETQHHELHHKKQNGGVNNSSANLPNGALPPLEALMADISCGNWGVLLGKSGSSSGSEAGGFSAYNRNIPMARQTQYAPPPPPAPANPSHFTGGGVGPYHMAAGRNPYMGGAPPQAFMPFSPTEAMLGGTYPYMGRKGFGAYPSYPGMEGYHFGGSAYPPYPPMAHDMNGMGSYGHAGPSYMNNVFPHSYNMGTIGYPMNTSNLSMGGARPKRNWGLLHVPYPPDTYREPHQGMGGARRSHERRFARERMKERQMRRPNQMLMNSTFDMDDEEIESISVV